MGHADDSSPVTHSVAPGGSSVELVGAPLLYCHAVVRTVPGRRTVCRGEWQAQPVYAKIFAGKKAYRDATRDASGVKAMLNAGIISPALLFEGGATDGSHVLLYAAIPDARNAEELAAEDPEGCFDLALKLVTTLAAHHRAGLLQTDLYLKNFLLQGDTVYSLDGDGIRNAGKALDKKRSLDHLAQLLSKFDVLAMQQWLPALLMHYLAERKWAGNANVAAVSSAIASHRYATCIKYAEQKVFRECTDVRVETRWSQRLAVARSRMNEAVALWAQSPDGAFLPGKSQPLKMGRTCTVITTNFGQERVVIKRYNIKSVAHGLNRAFRCSRAALSWANAYRLRISGIATATPVALLERRLGPLRREAYFVADYVDAPDIAQYFADAVEDDARKQAVAAAVAHLFRKLLVLGITHGDCKATNIKVVNGEPLLIDLDSMRQYRKPDSARAGHVRDLQRFLRNWQEGSAIRALLEQAFRNEYEDTGLLQGAGLVITSKTT